MTYHAYQKPNNITTFYVSLVAENRFAVYTPTVEEDGEMDIPDGVFFGSSSHSVLKERLERFAETVVFLEPGIAANRVVADPILTGTLLSPKVYRVLLQEWESFRLGGEYPAKTPAFLFDFMAYASRRPMAFMQITRQEYERFCDQQQVTPTYIKTDLGFKLLVKTPTVFITGAELDVAKNIQPDSFTKTIVDGKFRVNRDSEPSYFEAVHEEIVTMEFVVRSDFSVRVNFYNLYGDCVVEIFDAKSSGPLTPKEIAALIKKRAVPEPEQPPEPEVAPAGTPEIPAQSAPDNSW